MIFEKLQKIIVDQLVIDPNIIKLESRYFDDLHVDSLDLLELIITIEDEFNIKIPDSEVTKITTIKQTVDALEKIIC